MQKTIPFTDETREQIITEQQSQGFRLYEEQRHLDGWWLLFTDKLYIEQEPEPPLVFEPPKTGIPERLEYIEQYLKRAFGRQE